MSIHDDVTKLIEDLDTARATGWIFTYGQVQERLRGALAQPETPPTAAHPTAAKALEDAEMRGYERKVADIVKDAGVDAAVGRARKAAFTDAATLVLDTVLVSDLSVNGTRLKIANALQAKAESL